jgi:arylsulfatase A-like enzyme
MSSGKLLPRAAARFGLTLGLWLLLLRLDAVRVARAALAEIAGEWEMTLILTGAPSLALAMVLPIAAILLAYGACLPLLRTRIGRVAWASTSTAIAAALGLALTTGRKAQALPIRVPFVLGLAAVALASAWWLLPRFVELSRRRPAWAIVAGISTFALAAAADVRILPRLYPVFHGALLVLEVAATLAMAEGILRTSRAHRRGWAGELLGALGLVTAGRALMLLPWAGPRVAVLDNARRVLDERSPWFARAIVLSSAHWRPRASSIEPVADPLARSASSAAPSLSLAGRDVLLVTIDALRADHVGAYGYGRPTTPSIDALAREGTTFRHAYTPAPHTSYAIGSLMTGKFLRSVLSLESAAAVTRRPDETLAGLLRTYGYRTAAFHPPAIFYVDAERFAQLSSRSLDFEYAKVEFASPELRARQVAEYLTTAPKDKPLFLWVHLFEPHEPYLEQPGHHFGDGEIDRYDSEIAAADAGVGAIVASVRAARPGAVVIVSADHGEAFGEHGARYHGTTVYEEQVRVPLVVSAPGLVAARTVGETVSLIDVAPTLLAGLSIPLPPRMRGRDLGSLLAGGAEGRGVAFAEVEDGSMLALGDDRLICEKHAETCALYDVAKDPFEIGAPTNDAAKIATMRASRQAIERASAELEGFATEDGKPLPEALRVAMEGDRDAAVEVAALLDDVNVRFRRRAAATLARLANADAEPQVQRAWGREKDPSTRAWLAVASLRMRPQAKNADATAVALAAIDPSLVATLDGAGEPRIDRRELDPSLARWAALAVAASSSGRGLPASIKRALAEALVAGLAASRSDAEFSREVLGALPNVAVGESAHRALGAVVGALDDVRLRTVAAETLGLLGDPAASIELARRLAAERHLDARAPEALALARVGRGDLALRELARILGVPDAAPGGAAVLLEVMALESTPSWASRVIADEGGSRCSPEVPRGAKHRLVLMGVAADAKGSVEVAGATLPLVASPAGAIVELGDRMVIATGARARIRLREGAATAKACALVSRVDDLPPPKRDRGVDEGPEEPSPHR